LGGGANGSNIRPVRRCRTGVATDKYARALVGVRDDLDAPRVRRGLGHDARTRLGTWTYTVAPSALACAVVIAAGIDRPRIRPDPSRPDSSDSFTGNG
jgi:hypothetical protein